MAKPDQVLRHRPLMEVETALERLKRVVLFHPDPVSVAIDAKYCVCRQGAHRANAVLNHMIQCDSCLDWFHFDCVGLIGSPEDQPDDWKCEWCCDTIDREGFQRWRTNRKLPRKRHFNDTPRARGLLQGGELPQEYSNPPSWEGKVLQVKEIARRKAVKKRNLDGAAQALLDGGGQHLMDAERVAGIERRAVSDAFVDDLVAVNVLDPDDYEEN